MKKDENTNSLDELKAFKHDFINIFTTMGGFIKSHDLNGLEKYYNDLDLDFQKINTDSPLNPLLINNPGIFNLLSAKYQKAIKSNVKIKFDCFFDFAKLNMPIYDFSRIIGILIDNAIEAASITCEKKVNIYFRNSANSHTQIFEIENSCDKEIPDISKIFEKGVTEKNGHLGLGLWKVNQILNKYNNANLITNLENNQFKHSLEIYY